MGHQTAVTPATHKLTARSIVAVGAAVGAIGIVLAVWILSATYVSSSAVSPNQRFRAEIVDRSLPHIDRNFRVRLVDDKGNARMVFGSPDEPPSGIGLDRLLWSADGKRFLLVGKFWVREGAEIADGECLYLLCDVASGQVWCNSDQQVAPGFGREELAGFDLSSVAP